jgi:TolB-like protein
MADEHFSDFTAPGASGAVAAPWDVLAMDCLGPDAVARLKRLQVTDYRVGEAVRQVERILASPSFARVPFKSKSRCFLIWVVAKTLLGQSDEIKESTVAVSVFHDDPADFDPAIDAKVRVAGKALRKRMTEYYRDFGENDSIEIVIPRYTFVPRIRDRRVVVVVSLFDNWQLKDDQQYLCSCLSDDITHVLNQTAFVRAIRVVTLKEGMGRAQYGLRGSLERQGHLLRANISLADLSTGESACWCHFEEHRDHMLTLATKAAEVLLRVITPAKIRRTPIPATTRRRALRRGA